MPMDGLRVAPSEYSIYRHHMTNEMNNIGLPRMQLNYLILNLRYQMAFILTERVSSQLKVTKLSSVKFKPTCRRRRDCNCY